ncbi:MAG: TonB-dependent receptor, partial [Bacteroidota bacterium]
MHSFLSSIRRIEPHKGRVTERYAIDTTRINPAVDFPDTYRYTTADSHPLDSVPLRMLNTIPIPHSTACAFLTLILAQCNALAQQADDSRPEKENGRQDTVYAVGEVVVTAARRASSAFEVPLAISVLERREMSYLRGIGIDEALRGIPGVLAQSRAGGQDVKLTIRGFGARAAGEGSNSGTSRGVRVVLDGLPETEPDGRTSFDLIDLSAAGRVEIIRSNASAIWGNAAGGVVNIMSNTFFQNPYASLQTIAGSYGYRKILLQAGALVGAGKWFLSLGHLSFDGWRKHSRSARTLLNTGLESNLGEHTRLGVYVTAAGNSFRIPGPLTPSQFSQDPRQAQNDTLAYNPTFVQRDERRFNRLGRLGVTFSHDFDPSNNLSATAFITPKFLQRSERNTFRDFTRYHVGGSTLYKNAVRFSPDIKNMLQLGVDVGFQDGAILFYNLMDGQRGSLKTNKREGALSFGAFVVDEVMISNALSLVLGARYDNVTYTHESFYEEDPSVPLLQDRRSFSRVTPKIGVTYRFSGSHSIYANLGGGLEVPAGNETNPPSTLGADTIFAINPLLDASNSNTLELGTKQILSFPGNAVVQSWMYDLALYWIQVNNDFIPYRGGRFYFTAADTRRMGFEAGTSVQFTPGISILAALTMSHNIYKDYVIDSVHYGRPGRTADLSGNKAAGIPDLFYHVQLRYTPGLFGGFFAEIALQGVGRYFTDDYNKFTVPDFAIWNGLIGFDAIHLHREKLVARVSVGVSNIGDNIYAASGWVNPDLSALG